MGENNCVLWNCTYIQYLRYQECAGQIIRMIHMRIADTSGGEGHVYRCPISKPGSDIESRRYAAGTDIKVNIVTDSIGYPYNCM